MIIEHVMRNGNYIIELKGGWVTQGIVEAVLRQFSRSELGASASIKVNDTTQCVSSSLTLLDNHIFIEINSWVDESLVEQLCDNIQTAIRPVFPTAFRDIMVSPYTVPDYKDSGGLTLVQMIVDELGCGVSWGDWITPITLTPSSNVQYNQVMEYLDMFKLKYHNFKRV